MNPPHDLGAAAEQVIRLAGRVTDPALDRPTPCAGWAVRDVVEHVVGLTGAFTATARKQPAPGGEVVLDNGWVARLDADLDGLVRAWRAPEAWTGEAEAGGVTMPAAMLGVVALSELVLHGWDLARGLDETFVAAEADVRACLGWVETVSEGGTVTREGLYGPALTSSASAEWDRLLTLAGRDPAWAPRASV